MKIKNTKGANLTEYGLIVGLIAIIGIVSVNTLGRDVEGIFCDTAQALAGEERCNVALASAPVDEQAGGIDLSDPGLEDFTPEDVASPGVTASRNAYTDAGYFQIFITGAQGVPIELVMNKYVDGGIEIYREDMTPDSDNFSAVIDLNDANSGVRYGTYGLYEISAVQPGTTDAAFGNASVYLRNMPEGVLMAKREASEGLDFYNLAVNGSWVAPGEGVIFTHNINEDVDNGNVQVYEAGTMRYLQDIELPVGETGGPNGTRGFVSDNVLFVPLNAGSFSNTRMALYNATTYEYLGLFTATGYNAPTATGGRVIVSNQNWGSNRGRVLSYGFDDVSGITGGTTSLSGSALPNFWLGFSGVHADPNADKIMIMSMNPRRMNFYSPDLQTLYGRWNLPSGNEFGSFYTSSSSWTMSDDYFVAWNTWDSTRDEFVVINPNTGGQIRYQDSDMFRTGVGRTFIEGNTLYTHGDTNVTGEGSFINAYDLAANTGPLRISIPTQTENTDFADFNFARNFLSRGGDTGEIIVNMGADDHFGIGGEGENTIGSIRSFTP